MNNQFDAPASELLAKNLLVDRSSSELLCQRKQAQQTRIEVVTRLAAQALQAVPNAAAAQMLSIGCFDGKIEQGFLQQGWKVTGLDDSESALDRARRRGLKTTLADFSQPLPYPSDSFDFIFAGEVIEHLLSPMELLGEIRRVLKPGGTVVLTTPNLARLQDRLRFIWGCSPKHVAPLHPVLYLHIRPFTWGTLRQALQQGHFSDIRLHTNHVSLSLGACQMNLPLLPLLAPSLGRSLIAWARVQKSPARHLHRIYNP